MPVLPHPSPRLAAALLLAATLLAPLSAPANAQRGPTANGSSSATSSAATLATVLAALEFREIGPAVMGGRVAALAVDESNPARFFVGFASGGVWKTESQGMQWEPLFDDQPTASVGALALAPSNPNIIWVGTGEPQNRQSSPYGEGVFRSIDGGRTWQFKGLADTRQISRVIVHPTNPDIVYVAAMGHLWGPNEQRGVFKTSDGGETWAKVLYINDNTGAIDLAVDPRDPETLFAAMYQRQRTAWGYSGSGAGSGLYRTLDGGTNWTQLEEGLPAEVGRIGLDVYRGDSNLLFATVEARGDDNGVYRSTDRGASWQKMSDNNPRPMYFSHIRIDPSDPERIWMGGVSLEMSEDGGRTWVGNAAEEVHVDHHALWIDPSNSNHVISGNDGGVASTFDRGGSWRHHNNLSVGQFYEIGVDMAEPYNVCGGLQDNSSWCGPSSSLHRYGIRNADWYDVSGGDGFYNKPDPTDPNIVYTESQGGNISRHHIATGEQARIRALPRPTADDSARSYRFNWNAPIHISHHDPRTIYHAANHLLRSRDRGQTWQEASPDLTRQVDRDTLTIMGRTGITRQNTLSANDGVSNYGNITVIGESPLNANVLYAGTDDGKLSVTRDGGTTWTDVTRSIAGLVNGMLVSGIAPSHHVEGRVYMTFDGHNMNDYAAHVFASEDYGARWRRIENGLPEHSVNVIREHPRTADLLFVGNEVGVFASFDRGATWRELEGNLPTVPVDDIVIHPRDNDLVLGTHGRSIWVLDDIAMLEEIAASPGVLASAAHVFQPRQATMWSLAGANWPFWGDLYAADNAQDGVVVRYWLASEADDVAFTITDDAGNVIRTADASGDVGMNEFVWDFRMDAPYTPDEDAGQGGGRFNRAPRGPIALPGTYTIRLQAPGVVVNGDAAVALERRVAVRLDPRIQPAPGALEARMAAFQAAHTLAAPVWRAQQTATAAASRLEAVRAVLEAAAAGAALEAEADSVEAALERAGSALGDASRGSGAAGAMEGIVQPPTSDQAWQIEEAWRQAPVGIRMLNDALGQLEALEAKVFTAAARPPAFERLSVPQRRQDEPRS